MAVTLSGTNTIWRRMSAKLMSSGVSMYLIRTHHCRATENTASRL